MPSPDSTGLAASCPDFEPPDPTILEDSEYDDFELDNEEIEALIQATGLVVA